MKYLILLSPFLLSGCMATTFRGETDDVSFSSTPPGIVKTSDGQSCGTPCKLLLKRNQPVEVRISAKSCETYKVTLMPRISSTALLYAGVMDYEEGGVFDLQPNPVNVVLECK